jgi:hypothetical protein
MMPSFVSRRSDKKASADYRQHDRQRAQDARYADSFGPVDVRVPSPSAPGAKIEGFGRFRESRAHPLFPLDHVEDGN